MRSVSRYLTFTHHSSENPSRYPNRSNCSFIGLISINPDLTSCLQHTSPRVCTRYSSVSRNSWIHTHICVNRYALQNFSSQVTTRASRLAPSLRASPVECITHVGVPHLEFVDSRWHPRFANGIISSFFKVTALHFCRGRIPETRPFF